jgi:hypothetical protein
MYFLNAEGTICHVIEDIRTGKAPEPCGFKAHKIELLNYHKGKPTRLLKQKPPQVPLCKHCEKAGVWTRDV